MFNLASIRKLVTAALWSGVLAGLLLTATQQIPVIPGLLQLDARERSTASEIVAILKNSHAYQNWQTEYLERIFFNTLANISQGVGSALLIGSIMRLYGRPDNWCTGLLWGLAGYVTFFAAPSLGLTPEIPSNEAIKQADRNSWWLITVLGTGFGLSMLTFAKTGLYRLFGARLLAAPHLISAPQPAVSSHVVPVELTQFFTVATVFANAFFWLAIGGLMGHFYKDRS